MQPPKTHHHHHTTTTTNDNSFDDEEDMLFHIALYNKAVAAVVLQERVTHLQLHDYHGGASLLYMPRERRPAVLYVGHNAHYDLTTPMPTEARRHYVYSVLGLNAEEVARYAEHKGHFDFLRNGEGAGGGGGCEGSGVCVFEKRGAAGQKHATKPQPLYLPTC